MENLKNNSSNMNGDLGKQALDLDQSGKATLDCEPNKLQLQLTMESMCRSLHICYDINSLIATSK